MRELRPYQAQAIDDVRAELMAGSSRVMLQLATGGGKTRIAAEIVDGALTRGKRVIFTVPSLSLIDQTVQAFWDEGLRDIGVIQAKHPMTDPKRAVQVASVQTLERRVIPKSDVVVLDEAHRWFKLYTRWMTNPDWERVPFIGLSATPWTRGLGRHFDKLIIAATTQQLIDARYLTPFRVFAPSHPDLNGVRTVAGDYHEGDLSEAMGKPHLVADVVSTWLARGEGRPTLCFGVDRAHAKKLQSEFQAAGVPAGYIDGFTDREEREDIRKAFHRGELKVVCNVGCLTTGVDWDVRCIVLARPTKSEMLFVQIIGRGLRLAEGKADCLILDHSDTTLRLGFVTDIHHDEMDDGSADRRREVRKVEALPKECPKCSYLKPAKMHVCPSCSFAPERKSKIECESGDLLEMTGAAEPKRPSPQVKADWYAMLLGYAERFQPHKTPEQREKLALAHFRAKFLEWPHRKRGVEPWPPSDEVIRFVRYRNIAFAKRREKEDRANAA